MSRRCVHPEKPQFHVASDRALDPHRIPVADIGDGCLKAPGPLPARESLKDNEAEDEYRACNKRVQYDPCKSVGEHDDRYAPSVLNKILENGWEYGNYSGRERLWKNVAFLYARTFSVCCSPGSFCNRSMQSYEARCIDRTFGMSCIVKAYILNHMATEGPGRTVAIRTATSGVTGPCSLRILVTICPSQAAGGCLRNSRDAGAISYS